MGWQHWSPAWIFVLIRLDFQQVPQATDAPLHGALVTCSCWTNRCLPSSVNRPPYCAMTSLINESVLTSTTAAWITLSSTSLCFIGWPSLSDVIDFLPDIIFMGSTLLVLVSFTSACTTKQKLTSVRQLDLYHCRQYDAKTRGISLRFSGDVAHTLLSRLFDLSIVALHWNMT